MTKFEEIYELATVIMESEEIRQAPLYKKYLFLYRFLQFSIAEFNTRCYKDLTTIKPYSYKTYSIIGDGLEKEFKISSPFSFDTEIYVEEESSKNTGVYVMLPENSYYKNEINNSIVFFNAPKDGIKMNIYTFCVGYFYDDLEIEEKSILANGMVVAFYQNQLNKSTLMNQQLYGVGAKMYSQAEHIKRVSELLQTTRYNWTAAINAYTYSKSPDLVLDKSRNQKEIKKNYKERL